MSETSKVFLENSQIMIHAFFREAKANGRNELWMYVVGIILIGLGYVVGQIPLTIVLFPIILNYDGPESQTEIIERAQSLDFGFLGIDSNVGTFLALLSFVGGMIGIWITIRFIHKRTFTSLITPFKKIDWGRFGFGFGLWLLLAILGETASYLMKPENYELTFELSSFLPLLLICIFILPIQTSFEEIAFRGYLLQGLGMAIKNPLIPLILTSIGFGLLHGMNPEINEFGFWKMMIFYIGTGLFLGIITIMDERLELALGVHYANNLFGALFVTFEGSALQTSTIFRSSEINTDFLLVGWLIFVGVFTALAAWKYKWKNWNKLYQNIDFAKENQEYNIS